LLLLIKNNIIVKEYLPGHANSAYQLLFPIA
jgi:hypothetical protein